MPVFFKCYAVPTSIAIYIITKYTLDYLITPLVIGGDLRYHSNSLSKAGPQLFGNGG